MGQDTWCYKNIIGTKLLLTSGGFQSNKCVINVTTINNFTYLAQHIVSDNDENDQKPHTERNQDTRFACP